MEYYRFQLIKQFLIIKGTHHIKTPTKLQHNLGFKTETLEIFISLIGVTVPHCLYRLFLLIHSFLYSIKCWFSYRKKNKNNGTSMLLQCKLYYGPLYNILILIHIILIELHMKIHCEDL